MLIWLPEYKSVVIDANKASRTNCFASSSYTTQTEIENRREEGERNRQTDRRLNWVWIDLRWRKAMCIHSIPKRRRVNRRRYREDKPWQYVNLSHRLRRWSHRRPNHLDNWKRTKEKEKVIVSCWRIIEPKEMLLDLSHGRSHSNLSVLIQFQQFQLRFEKTSFKITIGRCSRSQCVNVIRKTMNLQHIVVKDDITRPTATVGSNDHTILNSNRKHLQRVKRKRKIVDLVGHSGDHRSCLVDFAR